MENDPEQQRMRLGLTTRQFKCFGVVWKTNPRRWSRELKEFMKRSPLEPDRKPMLREYVVAEWIRRRYPAYREMNQEHAAMDDLAHEFLGGSDQLRLIDEIIRSRLKQGEWLTLSLPHEGIEPLAEAEAGLLVEYWRLYADLKVGYAADYSGTVSSFTIMQPIE